MVRHNSWSVEIEIKPKARDASLGKKVYHLIPGEKLS